jgi:Mrp family chromosome partitioning ATPase
MARKAKRTSMPDLTEGGYLLELETAIRLGQPGGEGAVWVVSSLADGEGKTTVAWNLGRLLAREGTPVVVASVSAEAVPGGDDVPTLAEWLDGRASKGEGDGPRLVSIPASVPGQALRADAPRAWAPPGGHLILDLHPLEHVLTTHLAARANGLVLAVDSPGARVDELVAVRARLQQMAIPLLGVVLNRHRSPVPRWIRARLGYD